MYWRPLNLQSSSLLTYWKKIRICILISWAFILLDLSAQENGEHGRPMTSLAEMNLHFLRIFYYLPVAAQKLWNLHRRSWLLLERFRNMLKNLKYVSSLANLSDTLLITLNLSKYWNFVAGLHGFISLQWARKVAHVSSIKLGVQAASFR